MTNKSRLILFASMLIVALTACSRKQDAEEAAPSPAPNAEAAVRIAAVASQVDAKRLEEFTKRTGVAVQVETAESSRELETRVLAGDSGLDVVVLNAAFLQRQVNAGIFQKLSKEWLPNLQAVDNELLRRAAEHDPHNEQSVPYRWRAAALSFDEQRVRAISPEASLDSWNVLLDLGSAAAMHECGIGIVDSPSMVLKVMLMWMGRDPRQIGSADIDAVRAHLLALRPFIREVGSSAQLTEELARGELCLAITWVAPPHRSTEAQSVRHSVPKEGSVVQFDVLAVPVDAKQAQRAHELIDFLLQPDRAEADPEAGGESAAITAGVPLVAATALSTGAEQDMTAAWTAFLAR